MERGLRLRSCTAAGLALLLLCFPVAAHPGQVGIDLTATEKALSWFEIEPFKAEPYIHEAVRIQAMGSERSEYLRRLTNERLTMQPTFLLCRMLFQARRKSEFRAPYRGSGWLLGCDGHFGAFNLPEERWPLYPLVVVDGVPFLVVRTGGWEGMGMPETSEKYLDYCLGECDWCKTQYHVRSAREKQHALRRLVSLKAWDRPLNAWEKNYLSAQIE